MMEHLDGWSRSDYMRNLSKILGEAVEKASKYNSRIISKEMENIPNIWCRLEDDSRGKWYLISEMDGKSVKKYFGYLSHEYPVALLFDECPHEVKELLKEKQVLLDKYNDNYSCDENILKNYIDEDIIMLDDRFLSDETILFDEETFLRIDEGIEYINPYNFSFESIK